MEETGATIGGDPTLVFCGLVNDPRNTQTAWIETSAYLFTVPDLTAITGRDDVVDAGNARLICPPKLPPRMAIVTRALDHLAWALQLNRSGILNVSTVLMAVICNMKSNCHKKVIIPLLSNNYRPNTTASKNGSGYNSI